MKEIKLQNTQLKLTYEKIPNNQNAVRVISSTQNAILPNQEIDNVAQIIEKNFHFVYNFFVSRIDSNSSTIDALDIEEISIKVVLRYLYMYNMWRNTYKNKENLSLDFNKKDLSDPETADMIFFYFKTKYPNSWLEKSAILLGMSETETSKYYQKREMYYNK